MTAALPPPVLIARAAQTAGSTDAPSRPAPTVVQLRSEALFAGADEVQILHAGAVYRLKRTALGKLILTK